MTTLIIGYGNPLRRDDGIGWEVVQALNNLPDDVMCIATHQLTPELTAQIATVHNVIFVDACVDGEAGTVQICPTIPAHDTHPHTHHLTPHALLMLAKLLYDATPSACLITITGADFGMGEGISEHVQPAIGQVVIWVRTFLQYQDTLSLCHLQIHPPPEKSLTHP